jgi:predicted RNase H-like HicB family nuclease
MKRFYTAVLRASGNYWVALCLENGLVGQGDTKDQALEKVREAIASFEEVVMMEKDIYTEPLTIGELHEFLVIESGDIPTEPYELRAVNA